MTNNKYFQYFPNVAQNSLIFSKFFMLRKISEYFRNARFVADVSHQHVTEAGCATAQGHGQRR